MESDSDAQICFLSDSSQAQVECATRSGLYCPFSQKGIVPFTQMKHNCPRTMLWEAKADSPFPPTPPSPSPQLFPRNNPH